MQPQLERISRSNRSAESAPALLLAYGVYLLLTAIFASIGRLVPSLIAWGIFLVIVVLTSRWMTLGWSAYNGIAAALFFSSIIGKPYGELHLHTAGQWEAAAFLVASALISSHTTRAAITSIREALTSQEDAWRT